MIIVRFLLRFVMIPLGLVTAALVVTLLLVVISSSKFLALLVTDVDAGGDVVETMVFAGAALFSLASASFAIALPAILAIAVAEIAAIRSWLYYPATGGLAAWIGWWTTKDVRTGTAIFNEPTAIAAAGIVGGLVYWMVAGWNAGFWKPVFAPPDPPQLRTPPPPAT